MDDRVFMRTVLRYWRRHGRHGLPWRTGVTPYRVLVSEVMLQQTQVERVIPFFRRFVRAYPSFNALAAAPTARLLAHWQGLGYNRRALNLRRCAAAVAARGGRLPRDYAALCGLPGIGAYTAGAMLAFAYDLPHPVLETNIRRVYLHHFFPRRTAVPDGDLLPLVARHVTRARSARVWYSALMDYGTHLARRVPNPNRRAAAYARQPVFRGSLRELRGRALARLVRGPVRARSLRAELADARTDAVLEALQQEGFIVRRHGGILAVPDGKS